MATSEHSLEDHQGLVIILNGPSSIGKSTLQKALQEKSSQLFLTCGIDTFFDQLLPEPDISRIEEEKKLDQYASNGEYIRGIRYTKDRKGNPSVPLLIGSAGDRVMHGMHQAIRGYAKAGNNIIVDYILYKPEYIEDLKEALKDSNVLWVGMYAPLDIIEEREKSRATSPIGHARSHYDTCHANIDYDLKLDASTKSPEQLADEVLEKIRSFNENF